MTAQEQQRRRDLKNELKALSRKIEALKEDAILREREQNRWYHGNSNGKMHVRNSGPRYRLSFDSRFARDQALERIREITKQLSPQKDEKTVSSPTVS